MLQSGEIDMLSRNTTWTLTRDASLGLHFTGVTYYDGQGFMVPKKSKVTSATKLKGATVWESSYLCEEGVSDPSDPLAMVSAAAPPASLSTSSSRPRRTRSSSA